MPRLIQNTLKPILELKKLKGIDNITTDDMRVPSGFLRKANNVDIDSKSMIHMREGILQSLLSGNCHSLWSDEGNLCFCVKDQNLIQINSIYKSGGSGWLVSYSIILANVGDSKMNFVPVPPKTFFSNLTMVGFIQDGIAYAFPEIDTTKIENSFRTKMIGGNLIEYFNSRLYAAQGNAIYHSVAGNPMVMDERKNFFTVSGPITMMLAVKDGLYVSAGNKVFFMRYLGEVEFPIEGGKLAIPRFDYKLLLNVAALKGSAIPIERFDLRKVGISGQETLVRVVIFSTNIGIFMGLPGGRIVDCTSDHYALYDIEEGASMVKWHNGYRQYIYLGQAPTGIGLVNLDAGDPSDTASITMH